MSDDITPEQIAAGMEIVALVGQLVKEAPRGQIPSGELYQRLMDKFSLDQFQSILRILVRANLITERNHLLTWIGPAGPEGQ